jgi:ectoine hydroxylase-related dioxygenase (phytanoyl-CoA dioxygenase family)
MNLDLLSDKEKILLPTEEEIAFYEKCGWYVSDKVVPMELIDAAIEGAAALYRGEKDIDHSPIVGPANDVFDESKILMNNEYACMQRSEIWDLVSAPVIAAIAARLARTEEIRLFADALMCKFPAKNHDNGVFGWHTDKAYWPSCTSNDMLTAWIPFQDVTIDMGPMHVIENSNQWEMDDELRVYCAAGNKNLDEFESYLKKSKRAYKNVPMTLKKGQLSFHNANTFHGSSVNTSEFKRMTLTIHFQDEKNQHRPSFDAQGNRILIGYERLCRKDLNENPDYRDPVWFPVLLNK